MLELLRDLARCVLHCLGNAPVLLEIPMGNAPGYPEDYNQDRKRQQYSQAKQVPQGAPRRTRWRKANDP